MQQKGEGKTALGGGASQRRPHTHHHSRDCPGKDSSGGCWRREGAGRAGRTWGWGRPQALTPAPSHRALRSQGKSLCSEEGGCGSCSPGSLTRLGTEEHHRPRGDRSQAPGRTDPRPSWTAHKLLPSRLPSQARRGCHGSKAHRTGWPGWGGGGIRAQGTWALLCAPSRSEALPSLVCPSFLPCGLDCTVPGRGGATSQPGAGCHPSPRAWLEAQGPRGTVTDIRASWHCEGHWGLVAL